MTHARARLRARFTILNRRMQISCRNCNRTKIDAVSPFTRQMKPYRFENAPLLAAFSNFQKHLAWLLCSGIIHGRLAAATAPFTCMRPIPLSCALRNLAFGLQVRVISKQYILGRVCRWIIMQKINK